MKGQKLFIRDLIRFSDSDTNIFNNFRFITNDKLYLESLTAFMLAYQKAGSENVLRCLHLSRVFISTFAEYFTTGAEIKKGYLQDFSNDISLTAGDLLSKDSLGYLKAFLTAVIDKKTPVNELNFQNTQFMGCEFFCEGQSWISFLSIDPNSAGVILTIPKNETRKIEDIFAVLDRIKYFSFQKGLLQDKFKLIKCKDSDSIYTCCECEPVDYMPSVCVFPRSVRVVYTVENEIDLNDFSNAIANENAKVIAKWEEEGKKNGVPDIFFFNNMASWDTFNGFMTFIYCFALTYPVATAQKEKITAYFSFYLQNKRYIDRACKCFSAITNFLIRYFLSFRRRIDYATCVKLRKKGETIKTEFDAISSSNKYTTLRSYLSYLQPATSIMYRNMDDINGLLIRTFLSCLVVLKAVEDYDAAGIVEKMRASAVSIQQMMLGNSKNPELNIYLSANNFLGNTTGDLTPVMIKERVEEFLEIEESKAEDTEEKNKRISNVLSNDFKSNLVATEIMKGIQAYTNKGESDANVLANLFLDTLNTIPNIGSYKEKLGSSAAAYYIDNNDVPTYQDKALKMFLAAQGIELNEPITEEEKNQIVVQTGYEKVMPDSAEIARLVESVVKSGETLAKKPISVRKREKQRRKKKKKQKEVKIVVRKKPKFSGKRSLISPLYEGGNSSINRIINKNWNLYDNSRGQPQNTSSQPPVQSQIPNLNINQPQVNMQSNQEAQIPTYSQPNLSTIQMDPNMQRQQQLGFGSGNSNTNLLSQENPPEFTNINDFQNYQNENNMNEDNL